MQLIFGALAPLIIYSSLEEHWRLKWHAPSGRALLQPSIYIRIVHDAALFLLGSAVIRQAVDLVFFLLT